MTTNPAVLAAVMTLGSAAMAAQDAQEQEALIRKRDQKLQSAFLKKAAWRTDYDKAREEARKSGKLIFAYFTRSYSP